MTWNDLQEVRNQNRLSSGLQGNEIWLVQSYSAIVPLWPGLFALLDFSIAFQWKGHGLISDLRSSNKKILDMLIVQVHGLTSHAIFQPIAQKLLVLEWGQNPACTTSIDHIWRPHMDLEIWKEHNGSDAGSSTPKWILATIVRSRQIWVKQW